jgi:hypothetical protein
MPSSDRVQPGDLITAEFMNQILERLEALERKLATPPPSPTLTLTFPTFPTFTLPTTAPTFTLPPTLTFQPTIAPTFTLPPTLTFQPTLVPPIHPIQPVSPFQPVLGPGGVQPESPVTTLPGLGRTESRLLRRAGIVDVKTLAAADAQNVAEALKVGVEEAAGMIAIAKNALERQ